MSRTSIAEKYGVEIWRWDASRQAWVARHRNGETDEVKWDSKHQKWSYEDRGKNISDLQSTVSRRVYNHLKKGQENGDWMVEILPRKQGPVSKLKYFSEKRVGKSNTVWVFKGDDWYPIYRRSSGNSDKPWYLTDKIAGLKDLQVGDIVFDCNIKYGYTEEDVNRKIRPLFVNRQGGYERINIESLAVTDPDDSTMAVAESALQQVPIEDARELALRRRAEKELVLALAVVEPLKQAVASNNRQLIKDICVKLLEEAAPSPTPGTSAITDYAGLGDSIAQYQDSLVDNVSGSHHVASNDHDPILADTGYSTGTISEAINFVGEFYAIVYGWRKLHANWKGERNAESPTERASHGGQVNTLAADLYGNVSKLFNTSASAVQTISSIVGHAATVVAIAGAAATGAGIFVSAMATIRGIRKAELARLRRKKLKAALNHFIDNHGDHNHDDISAPIKFLIGKTGRRHKVQALTAVGAATGGTGAAVAGLVTVGVIAAANVWNPVGWTLIGVGALAGLGVIGWKIYRRATREKRHIKREQREGGVADANAAGRAILAVYNNDKNDKGKRELAKQILQFFGIDDNDLDNPSRARSQEFSAVVAAQFKRHCAV